MFEKRTSEDIWKSWWTPHLCVVTLVNAGLLDTEHAVNWLHGRLKSGEMPATAVYGYWRHNYPMTIEEAEFPLVPLDFWRLTQINWKADFWISGDYRQDFTIDDDDALDRGLLSFNFPTGFQFAKVRLQPLVIEEFCAFEVNASSTPIASKQHSGGRPPKPFWDKLWAAIAAQIFNGDWKPDKQSDIEKAMHDWLALNNESAGETAVRARAKLLWLALNDKIEN